MEYKIGSLNMYKLSYQVDKEIRKNYHKISELILKERFDILAMQEVFNEASVAHIKKGLGPNWDYAWGSPLSKSVQAAEGYAFLWNAKKFRLATGTREDEQKRDTEKDWRAGKVFQPRVYDNYRFNREQGLGGLVRNPFYARFESVQGWFEIRLINTHIMFSDASTDDAQGMGDAEKRKRELEILIDICGQLSDRRYRSTRPAYTFLLGDYNLNLNRAWTKAPYLDEVIEKMDRNGTNNKRFITVQDQLTTLKRRSKEAPNEPVRGFANNYDHFTYDEIRFNGITLHCERINSVRKYWEDDFETHRMELSDHVPIGMTMDLKK